MHLQSGLSNCGAAALANALMSIGWAGLTTESVGELAGTTTDGTGAAGLKRAAKKLGASVDRIATRETQFAADALLGALSDGRSAVLLVDRGEHWIAAIGRLGQRIILVDSAAVVRPLISTSTRDALLESWHYRRVRERYAIVLGRQP
jgi:ABC-type bacteriocin/lantibiotic exporter with double-glycine peptidase domain